MSTTLKEKELEILEYDIMNKIHHMDCLEFMKDIPDNYFDLVLTDPPYGISVNKQGWHKYDCKFGGGEGVVTDRKYKDIAWDDNIPSQEVFEQMKRISKNQIIFGGNYFINHLDNTSCLLFWDKCNGASDFADGEVAWTNFKTAVRKYTFRWNGMLQQDMANKEERHHPTQKPTELFKMILRDYAIKLDKKTVFDPFGGSGTTGLAAKALGLNWCMCEKEEDYCKIAEERLKKVQLNLF